MELGKRVAIFDWEWGRNSAPGEGQKIPSANNMDCQPDQTAPFVQSDQSP